VNDHLPIIPILFSEEIAKISELLGDEHKDLKKQLTSKEKPTVKSYNDYHTNLQQARKILLGNRETPEVEKSDGKLYTLHVLEDKAKAASAGGPALSDDDRNKLIEARKLNKLITGIEEEIAATLALSEIERAARNINFYAQPPDQITLASAKKLSQIPTTATPPGTRMELPLHYKSETPDNPLSEKNKELKKGEQQALAAFSVAMAGIPAVLYGGYRLIKAMTEKIAEAKDYVNLSIDKKWNTEAMRANYWVEEDSVRLTQYHGIKSKSSGQTAELKFQALQNLAQLFKKQGHKELSSIAELERYPEKFKIEGAFQDQMWTLIQLCAQQGTSIGPKVMAHLNQKQIDHLDKLIETYKVNKSKEPDAAFKKGTDGKPIPVVAGKATAEVPKDKSLTMEYDDKEKEKDDVESKEEASGAKTPGMKHD